MNTAPPSNTKALIGLTGGIASGKSTVSQLLGELGVGVVDADEIAREVVAKGSEGLAAVVQAFGADCLRPDGELDRPRLGERIFADPEARARLNAITHPRIATRSAERIAELQETTTPYVVYDVPLLVETGLHAMVDAVIVVAASEATQVLRMVQRDGLSRGAALARIGAQHPLAKKIEVADYVIHNDGTLADLRRQTEDVHRQLIERFERT